MTTHIISFIILILLLWGRTLPHKNLKLHIKVMSITIFFDIGLVLYLSFGKRVLDDVSQKITPLLTVHIAMALMVVVLYLLTVYWGKKLLNGERRYLRQMRFADKAIVSLRIAVFVTALMLSYL